MINGFLCITLGFFTSFIRGCCSSLPPEPKHPGSVAGWKEFRDGGVHTIAILVLRKSESSDNGKIGVRVVDIIAADPCAGYGTLQRIPRVKLQFFEMPDRRVVCEDLLTDGSGTLLAAGPCGEKITKLGVSAVSVNAINATEGWVFFELRK
jgi:hypothetical protein